MTHLCAAIFVNDAAQTRRDVARALEAGADLIELRVDRLTLADIPMLRELLAARLARVIVTCRAGDEGGAGELLDADRLAFLQVAAESSAEFVDLELKTFEAHPSAIHPVPGEKVETRIILSSHDFTGRPSRLYNIITELDQSPADISKIVWLARTVRDNVEALDLLRQRRKPTIALCMGEAGIVSRVLAKKFGGFLTFASLVEGQITAPGQVSLAEMKALYRWDSLNESTRVYGVVAHPVRHSMSPAIHNAAFDATAFNGIYLPLLVDPSYESFKAFMETYLEAAWLGLSGLSVTIPHKENALRYLREKDARIEDLAMRIGAVNTIRIDRNGNVPELYGSNTDYAAILDSITTSLHISRQELAGLRVGILGAGGTGRTAVAALAHYGAEILVNNRNSDRAEALAEEFNGQTGRVRSVSLQELAKSNCDVWMNTTSVGMHPNVDANPFAPYEPALNARTVVFDAVYNPMQTKLLALAETAGAKVIGGVEMFVRQAAAQFETWTAITAPTDVMRRVIETRLSQKRA